MYARVKEHENLVRDMRTGAILNTDENAIKKHELYMHERKKQNVIQEQINSLKNDVSEIKDMLRALKDRGI